MIRENPAGSGSGRAGARKHPQKRVVKSSGALSVAIRPCVPPQRASPAQRRRAGAVRRRRCRPPACAASYKRSSPTAARGMLQLGHAQHAHGARTAASCSCTHTRSARVALVVRTHCSKAGRRVARTSRDLRTRCSSLSISLPGPPQELLRLTAFRWHSVRASWRCRTRRKRSRATTSSSGTCWRIPRRKTCMRSSSPPGRSSVRHGSTWGGALPGSRSTAWRPSGRPSAGPAPTWGRGSCTCTLRTTCQAATATRRFTTRRCVTRRSRVWLRRTREACTWTARLDAAGTPGPC